MSEAFVWKDTYRIGVKEIDEQHENLFRIANRLQDDLPTDRLRMELMNLYRHTREHFKAEEAVMRDAGFPQYLEHRRHHDELLDALNGLASEVMENPAKLPEFRAFLAEWISRHILNEDQEIAAYLRLD